MSNVLIVLTAAAIGYLIGRLWQTLKMRRRNWKARQFWQPVVDEQFQIVISRFSIDSFRDPAGLVGGGDALANGLLGDLFQDIGLPRPQTVYVDEEVDRNKNLIILGGPLENRVADEALRRIKPGLRVTDPGPGLAMQVDDLRGTTSSGKTTGRAAYVADPGTPEMTDYGVIIRARSPFHDDRALVVISGAYGYGTWAGVQLSRTDDFLRRCAELDAATRRPHRWSEAWIGRLRLGIRRSAVPEWAQIECLYRVDVLDRRPQTSEIVVFRRIDG